MAKPILFEPVASPFLVGESFEIERAPTQSDDDPGKAPNVEALEAAVEKLAKLQGKLYANHRYSVLLVFQAMDAAGKDGTIKAVLSGVNPQGVHVSSFKAPSSEELDHDFLWRVQKVLPARGMIGVWNRSHYEEVLVVRVHPEYLARQNLPPRRDANDLWKERFASITEAEHHWARNGCVILKFFLHVSQQEQHERFRARVTDAENHWKFNAGDLAESKRWADYMRAYQDALRATSKPWAPWYAIPADSKSFMRRAVAEIVVGTLKQLDLAYPQLAEKDRLALEAARRELELEK
jgi:PPK2 family polyphosphate:nucleotide phosphotransferase